MGAREIARAAVRTEVAEAALELFRRQGFDKVTVNDVAAAAGVSRSTFLRYFHTKEEAVFGAFDARVQAVADALQARPAEEDDWTALRRAFDGFVEEHVRDRESALTLFRLIDESPALCARRREKQHAWRAMIAPVLAERSGNDSLYPHVLAAAAGDCLEVAVERWKESAGRLDLAELVDEAFAVLAPAER